MSDRKSNRARKAVDYTKFGGEDDDDDFADSTPPVAKRAKLSNKENKEKKKNLQKKENKPKVPRLTPEERMFERELQEALQLSMSQSDGSQESTTSTPANAHSNDQPPILINDDDRAPSPILPPLEVAPVLTKIDDKTDIDVIEVIESSIEVVPSSRSRTCKPKKYIDSDSESGDSDFNPADADDSFHDGSDISDDDDDDDDDYKDEGSDSDFGPSKKKKKTVKKPAAKPKPQTNKSTPSKKSVNSKEAISKGTSKISTIKPKVQSVGAKSSCTNKSSPVTTACRTPSASVSTRKAPNWKPPGTASEGHSPLISNNKSRPTVSGNVKMSPLGGVNIKSPNSGLRLGLSRNMKLKSLHPNLKTNN